MKKILMAFALIFFAGTALAFAGDYEDGVAAYGKKDYSKALVLFKRSYAAGELRAANHMGLMYRDGKGVAKNKKEALKWFKLAAEKGDADAQYNLGMMHYAGFGKKHYKENSEAYRWVRKAAEQGHAKAQFRLGEMYDNGEGVREDSKEALKWYTASANAGYVDAEYLLGNIYLKGWVVQKDANEAVRWLARAAEGGKDEAAFDLGVMYKNGERVPRDYAEALRWFRMSADEGNGEAKCYVAEMYAAGHAVERDTAMAKKLLKEGRGLGGEQACERVAGRYGLGDTTVARAHDYEDGVAAYGKKDYSAALRFFKRAYAGGDLRAAYYLGLMYRDGAGVKKDDPREAIEWLRIAAEEGNAYAQMSLGGLYEGWADNRDEGAKWELLAAKQGLVDAQYYIGMLHLYGYTSGVNDPKGYNDPVEALMWFKLAADQGNTNAQDAIGSVYLNGWGAAEDHKEAYRWFHMAADKGNSESKCSLAKMYATGDTVEKDMAMAKKFFDEGQALGGGIGCDKVGWGYGLDKKDSAGYGTLVEEIKKDLVKPDDVKRLRTAADGGDGEAKCKLARLYAIGSGVETDMPRASKLFNEGVALGAGEFCNKIYEELKEYFIDIRKGMWH